MEPDRLTPCCTISSSFGLLLKPSHVPGRLVGRASTASIRNTYGEGPKVVVARVAFKPTAASTTRQAHERLRNVGHSKQ